MRLKYPKYFHSEIMIILFCFLDFPSETVRNIPQLSEHEVNKINRENVIFFAYCNIFYRGKILDFSYKKVSALSK